MSNHPLDDYLPVAIRTRIEQAYYARVNAQAQFEQLVHDPTFWQDPAGHPALFSDHGVVHVRDVAQQILQVLPAINGVLIPRRTPDRLENFMCSYGVMLAYLHDIGMTDLSVYGRAMHPEFAAQAVFTGELDTVIEDLWLQDCGQVAQRLTCLAEAGILKRDPQIIFRELLALSVGHSKSKTPIVMLDNPGAFRSQLQLILSHSLPDLYRGQQSAKGRPVDLAIQRESPAPDLTRFYSNLECEAFDWLLSDCAETRELVDDVVDTLRALRCADALRQRGTVQKTSGGYEVFVSQQTGNAIYALRLGDEKLYLMELANRPLSVGEANIASSEFMVEGNLRVSFQRGAYANDEALQRSVYYTALVIDDFLGDIVDSFWRRTPPTAGPLKSSGDIQVLLESTDDNPRFAELVQEQLRRFNSALGRQIHIVPSLQHVSELERAHYLQAKDLDWDLEQRQEILEHVRQSGQRITDFDLVEGFKHVRLIHLGAGETLIEAGAPASFVYVPLGDGLKINPLGGYQSFSVTAWMPVGNTGVIRGAIRNADVVAGEPISLLMIPKEVYLRQWYAPYTPEALRAMLVDKVT